MSVSTYFIFFLALAVTPAISAQTVVNVQALGAHPDGTNAAATTSAFKTAFSAHPTGQIVVPAGTYAINNSSGPLVINNFSGQLNFQPGAQLVFTANEQSGLLFEGGTGAIISGLTANWSPAPTYRNSPNEGIKFSDTTNTTVSNMTVYNSPAAGILFYNSINPVVNVAMVVNSWADGLHFANCQNAQVSNYTSQNTGDDGLAFLNYAQYPNKTGGLAQNISVTNSKTRGITVVGQSNVTISGFQILNTSSSGVLVMQDTAYNTRVPANVVVQNGTIQGAGTYPPGGGNLFGIEYNGQASVTFSNITVIGSGSSGFSGTSPKGSVTANGITVQNPGNGSVGFLFYQTGTVHATNLTANTTPSYGILFLKSQQVVASGLTAINTSITDSLKRAIWFEDSPSVTASSLNVISAPGDAYVLGCYTSRGITATGSVKTISSQITGRALSIQNSCSKLPFTQ